MIKFLNKINYINSDCLSFLNFTLMTESKSFLNSQLPKLFVPYSQILDKNSSLAKKSILGLKNSVFLKDQGPIKCYTDLETTRKLKICDGERLSYEVIKKDSKEKKVQFLQRYAHDPFMRKKLQKSIKKLSLSQGKNIIEEKTLSVLQTPESKTVNSSYTTLRQQIKEENKKTEKLLKNCKHLVEEIKKNKLKEHSKSENFVIGLCKNPEAIQI